jgi:hypothetical protein
VYEVDTNVELRSLVGDTTPVVLAPDALSELEAGRIT